MTDQEGSILAAAVREKIAAGTLPRAAPKKMWVGNGNGRPCDVCGRPIAPDQIEYEPDFPDHPPLRLHQACLDVWHQERLRHPRKSRTSAAEVREKIREVVRGHAGKALCTRCLGILIDVRVQVLVEAARRLEGDVEFLRGFGGCGLCGRERLVIALRSPKEAPETT